MPDPITPDPVALAGMTPSIKAVLAALYRDYAEAGRAIGLDALAARCELHASALSYGGDVILWDLEPTP